MKRTFSKSFFILLFFGSFFMAREGLCGGGGQIVIDQNWISARSTTLCWDKKAQESCYNESKACRDDFEKGLTDLLNKTCPVQNGDWWCDPDPNKDLAKLLAYVDNFKATDLFLKALKACNPPSPLCGDHILNGNDECDDGNTQDGDGCSGKCLIEVPSDVDGTCYQNLHDGTCSQKKQACDQIQGDKNCPEQLNQCLEDALKTCKKSNTAPAAQNTSPPPSSSTGSCSVSPSAVSLPLPYLVVLLVGLFPMAWIRARN